jgi:hypothetical protein
MSAQAGLPDDDPMSYYDEFNTWIMANYPVSSGDVLVELFENEAVFERFIDKRKGRTSNA